MMADALYIAGCLLLISTMPLLVRHWITRAAEQLTGDDEFTGQPFSEEDYSLNLAGSQNWEIRNAIRRAVTLVHEGRTTEAIGLLEKVKEAVPDQRVRTALDQEIVRLRGPAPEPAVPLPERRVEAPPVRSGDPGGDADEWPYPTTADTT
jgi:hypothetical protein